MSLRKGNKIENKKIVDNTFVHDVPLYFINMEDIKINSSNYSK